MEFEYDSLGQLVRESGSRGTYTVTYDTKGNILTKGNNTYTYGNSNWGDLLTAYNGTIINYDEIGNPNNWRDGMTFSWQKGKQLASVVKNGTTYSYAYDSTGIRTSKTVNGITTTFTYVDGKLIHQTDGTNNWWFYYDATDKLIAMEYNGEQYYYLYDSTGNIVGLMTYDALTVADYEYDAWGKLISATGDMANINPIRYKGYYYDQEIGLYYLQSRYYDPEIGRFINADEFTSTGQGVIGNNMFAYCGNNPVSREDSQGTFWDTVFDVISLVTSIVDVVRDPTDGWAWAGLAGDVLDLIPFVTCVGEAVKVARVASKAVDVVDTAYDTVKTVDKIGDAVDTVGDVSKQTLKQTSSVSKGWHVGDDITNLTKAGNDPSWSTVRQRYWKNEAFYNANQYSSNNLTRMRKGLAPTGTDGFSMELHHPNGRLGNNFFIFEPMTQTEHRILHYGR